MIATEPPVRVPLPFSVSGIVMVGSGVEVTMNGAKLSSRVTAGDGLIAALNTTLDGGVLKVRE